MTTTQEDALYTFLENRTVPFSAEDIVAHIRKHYNYKAGRLAAEVSSFIDSRNIAFKIDSKTWISKRGCFEPIPFVISPSRMEIINGILIPGHRCIPFANSILLPHEYSFQWNGKPVAITSAEGAPEEFYPYYYIFGEEYAPQYVARDNPDNEAAFNVDPYDDPPEVYIRTLDMRNIYRECAFVPGDRFLVRTVDWKNGSFSLEKVDKDTWAESDLQEWMHAAENGFIRSFEALGPGASTEEQISYAYWYGGERMRSVPAYSLEDFLYEKTNRIEITAYGIETRFWYVGKEIPDRMEIEKVQIEPDRSMIEEILYKKDIPISEYVVNSYVKDALFRRETDVSVIIDRIIPPVVGIGRGDRDFLEDYIAELFQEFQYSYDPTSDQKTGPIRQRAGELHTAVIDLIARLKKGGIDPLWLPKQTFILLSQLQTHAANILEEFDSGELIPENDLDAFDNSTDDMIETYEDMKEMIDEALNSFRHSYFSLVKPNSKVSDEGRIIQVSIGGTDLWRRIVVPETCTLEGLHKVIQTIFGWRDTFHFRFLSDIVIKSNNKILNIAQFKSGKKESSNELDPQLEIADLGAKGVVEISYEYGAQWNIKIILLARHSVDAKEPVKCVAGSGNAPPESIEGPIKFKKYISLLANGSLIERQSALQELGKDFNADLFDISACNRLLKDLYDKHISYF